MCLGTWISDPYRTATVSVRSCERIGMIPGLANESVCRTLTCNGLHRGGAGAFACQPIFSQLLSLRERCSTRVFSQRRGRIYPAGQLRQDAQLARLTCGRPTGKTNLRSSKLASGMVY